MIDDELFDAQMECDAWRAAAEAWQTVADTAECYAKYDKLYDRAMRLTEIARTLDSQR